MCTCGWLCCTCCWEGKTHDGASRTSGRWAADAVDVRIDDGVIAEIGTGLDDADVVDGAGAILLPGLVDLHTHLREPGREDAETVATGTRAAAVGWFHRRPRHGQHRPGGRHRRCRGAGVAAGAWRPGTPTSARWGRSPSGWQGKRLAELGAMADSAARCPGLQRRRALRLRRAAHAPGAGVREGLRRGDRPARPGATADRGRADARGRAVRPTRSARLAGGRGGGDHRPRRAAGRSRRVPVARLPRVDGRIGGDPAVGQEPGDRRHRGGDTAPPAAHRRPGHHLRPDLQGQPTAALGRPTSRPCAQGWPRA